MNAAVMIAYGLIGFAVFCALTLVLSPLEDDEPFEERAA